MSEQTYEVIARMRNAIRAGSSLSLKDSEFLLDLLLRYKFSLESLTPGGSEFVNDPERCAEHVRARSRGLMREIVRLKQLKERE